MGIRINESDFIFYNGEDGRVHAQVILGDETVWCSQGTISEIFGIDRTGISRHINNILQEKELDEKSNVQFLHIANSDKPVGFYSLDIIIAVGYRVNSYKATKFRQWATHILKEYLIKGFAMDDERLKQGNKLFGKDYFRELLERIRQIRASERMFYEKITDLYATSIDYDKDDPATQHFFANVQNKLEFAIVGMTSAKIIKKRVNAKMPNMGLTTWKNVNRDGRILKSDVTIAKNYLKSEELAKLNLLVSMFLDYAESLASKNKVMKMDDWAVRLDSWLEFNEYEILKDFGKVKRKVADSFAEKQFAKFSIIQDKTYKSDFNKTIETIKKTGGLPKEGEAISTPHTPIVEFDSTSIAAKEPRKKRVIKPKTKTCPVCGKETDKNAQYCDGYVDEENIIACRHIY